MEGGGMIPWGWIGGTFLAASALFGAAWWWWTRRKPASISDSAGELAEAHRVGAREKAEAELALAVAVGEKGIAEAEALAEKEIENAVSAGGLADTLNTWPRDS